MLLFNRAKGPVGSPTVKIRYTQEKLEKVLQRFVFWFRCHTHRLAFNF